MKVSILCIILICLGISRAKSQSYDTLPEKDLNEKYQHLYKKASYTSIEDEYLKKILQPYFDVCEEKVYPSLCYEYKAVVQSENVQTFSSDSGAAKDYKIKVVAHRFNIKEHKITFSRSELQNSLNVYLIDDNIFFGTDGSVPYEELKSIEVTYKNKIVQLPKNEYQVAYNPLLERTRDSNVKIAIDKQTGYMMLILFGSDGAGTYTAVWIFKEGKYLRMIIESHNC